MHRQETTVLLPNTSHQIQQLVVIVQLSLVGLS